MDRIVGIETEYGCLLSEEESHVNSEVWPAKVKNYLFRKAQAGTIDLHYRDYEEPPGNGGFLLNGGRLYLDMGHIEYASPECLHLRDLVAYDLAGDELLQSSLAALGGAGRVSFIKNNVDHHTGATFGCHENYLMKREAQFTPPILGTLLTFLATRQIFTGAGRVGQANPLAFDFEPPPQEAQVNFQLSQRADHIGTTACVLSLLEEGRLPRNLVLTDAVQSTRDISRDSNGRWIVDLENGKTIGALDVQWQFYDLAQRHLRETAPKAFGAETDWLLESWSFVLEALEQNPHSLIGGVDWITKKWLLETFIESEGLSWDDPWLQSIDLEYHNIDPARGLFFGVTPGKRIGEWNNSVRRPDATHTPPSNTRASGRARAVASFQQRNQSYVINWDSIACDSRDFLVMGDPFKTYNEEVAKFLTAARPHFQSSTEEDGAIGR